MKFLAYSTIVGSISAGLALALGVHNVYLGLGLMFTLLTLSNMASSISLAIARTKSK